MKKVLAVVLSVMMLFSALSVGASAIDTTSDRYIQQVLTKQAILSFNLNGGSIKGGVKVYDGSTIDPETKLPVAKFSWDIRYTDSIYYMIPEKSTSQVAGDVVTLPSVTPPSGYAFNGWYCYTTNETYAANRPFTIPSYAAGTVIEFTADYSRSEPEEDTMGGVMNILVKVFGSVIGLLFLQGEADPVDAGMKMMQGLLDNLFE